MQMHSSCEPSEHARSVNFALKRPETIGAKPSNGANSSCSTAPVSSVSQLVGVFTHRLRDKVSEIVLFKAHAEASGAA